MLDDPIEDPLAPRETVGFGGLGSKLNWLRAAVLGANDGVVSGAGITIGVAAADPTAISAIMLAGVAGLLAGASAMAMGEYVSVSSQRDTEEALISKERHDLEHTPDEEFEELVDVYRRQGLSDATARKVVQELHDHDALAAHLRTEYGMHQEELTTPWHAAIASAISFTVGFALPLLAMLVAPAPIRIPVTVVVGLVGLFLTGLTSAIISGSPKSKPILRNVVGGSIAMALTWSISHLFGVATG
ncbi:MAG TPA: VIT family protein [Candidatus Dormibacteraeota bacterium]|nr:VIT family protein [Candidatus Dormibacteraeota bacterium]